jgi:5-hydroxyisourate hydrolase
MSSITTHVLDLARGRPAVGVAVVLQMRDEHGGWRTLGQGATDADGRLGNLISAQRALAAGIYQLTFDVGSYFQAAGVECFYPSIAITFEVRHPAEHHHVPLLVSPFGYSTYRGS